MSLTERCVCIVSNWSKHQSSSSNVSTARRLYVSSVAEWVKEKKPLLGCTFWKTQLSVEKLKCHKQSNNTLRTEDSKCCRYNAKSSGFRICQQNNKTKMCKCFLFFSPRKRKAPCLLFWVELVSVFYDDEHTSPGGLLVQG